MQDLSKILTRAIFTHTSLSYELSYLYSNSLPYSLSHSLLYLYLYTLRHGHPFSPTTSHPTHHLRSLQANHPFNMALTLTLKCARTVCNVWGVMRARHRCFLLNLNGPESFPPRPIPPMWQSFNSKIEWAVLVRYSWRVYFFTVCNFFHSSTNKYFHLHKSYLKARSM